MDERCKTCRFFLPQEKYNGGKCRRYPPTLVGTSVESDRYGRETDWSQDSPYMQDMDWCGEYQRANSAGDANG